MGSSTRNNLWTGDELKIALLLYFQIPFGRIDKNNKEIIALSIALGRTPSAVAMKLLNISSLDREITSTGRVGLQNASALDRSIWAWYHADWSAAVEEATNLRDAIDQPAGNSWKEEPTPLDYTGNGNVTESPAFSKRRIGQDFFRNAVLANFEMRCCVTGVSVSQMLCASHIVPWAADASERLNPANGLCLVPTLDRAFDRGFVCFRPDRTLKVSKALINDADAKTRDHFAPFVDARMRPFSRFFIPDEKLEWHRTHVFEAWKAA